MHKTEETTIALTLINVALKSAIQAGVAIMEIYNKPFDVEIKNDLSPLTIADKASNELILQELNKTGIPVLSEEGASIPWEERKSWQSLWIVDPLDGTKEFIKKNGEFTVNIALVADNAPVLGVIYVPATDVLYYGITGTGAFKIVKANEVDIGVNFEDLEKYAVRLPENNARARFTIVSSRSHMSDETAAFTDKYKNKFGETDFISKGSSLKICLVAEGAADLYPRLAPTMEWDTAAGQAIATACGCKVVIAGTMNEVTYNKENLLNPFFVVYGPGFDIEDEK